MEPLLDLLFGNDIKCQVVNGLDPSAFHGAHQRYFPRSVAPDEFEVNFVVAYSTCTNNILIFFMVTVQHVSSMIVRYYYEWYLGSSHRLSRYKVIRNTYCVNVGRSEVISLHLSIPIVNPATKSLISLPRRYHCPLYGLSTQSI